MKILVLIITLILAAPAMAQNEYSKPVDERSYHLGVMGGFSEVVKYGVKELALSEVMSPDEMDDILPDALVVARRNGVEMWREPDLLVSDLFPADVAKGKHVLLIYTGDTLDKYLAIKNDKAKLVAAGEYAGEARKEIARRFGRLLSYSEPAIDDLIRRNASK
ncbi:MAG: hypothetical protein R3192_11395 [Woeseiaceae bacterium]|nr:hypothetical protein [Woeseiaceae bacterium]